MPQENIRTGYNDVAAAQDILRDRIKLARQIAPDLALATQLVADTLGGQLKGDVRIKEPGSLSIKFNDKGNVEAIKDLAATRILLPDNQSILKAIDTLGHKGAVFGHTPHGDIIVRKAYNGFDDPDKLSAGCSASRDLRQLRLIVAVPAPGHEPLECEIQIRSALTEEAYDSTHALYKRGFDQGREYKAMKAVVESGQLASLSAQDQEIHMAIMQDLEEQWSIAHDKIVEIHSQANEAAGLDEIRAALIARSATVQESHFQLA